MIEYDDASGLDIVLEITPIGFCRGNNLFDFLENLDNLHARINTTFTGYTPPGFKLIRKSPNSATLVYTSSRHGLTAFVHGLLLGMQTRFNIDIEFVSIQTSTSDKGDRTVFELVTRTRN